MSYLTNRFWDHAPRYCSQHKAVAPIQGGAYRNKGNGRQAWVCQCCLQREKERAELQPT